MRRARDSKTDSWKSGPPLPLGEGLWGEGAISSEPRRRGQGYLYPHPDPLPKGEGGLQQPLPLNAYAPNPSPGRRGEPEESSTSNHPHRVADKHACLGCQDLRPPWRVTCDAALHQQNACFGRCCAAGRSCAPNSDASIPSDPLSSIPSASKLASSSRPMAPLTSPRPCATAAEMLGLLLRVL